MLNQFIALVLILAVWAALLAAYISYERIKKRGNRERFLRSLERWRVNG